MKKLLPILLITLLITSCHRKSEAPMYDIAANSERSSTNFEVNNESLNTPNPIPEDFEKQETNKKKIIKDGSMSITVTELERTKNRTDSLVKSHHGYYANEELSNLSYSSNYYLKIRIPQQNFEKFIADLESGDGIINSKKIIAIDVTDQFIDLETRLTNKRSYLERYKQLVKQARSIKEILEIEEKTRAIEEEIESAEGRLKFLSDQVGYSTLELTITKELEFKYTPKKRNKFSVRFKQSVSNGWSYFIDFLMFLFKLWPFLLIIGAVFYFISRIKKKRRKTN